MGGPGRGVKSGREGEGRRGRGGMGEGRDGRWEMGDGRWEMERWRGEMERWREGERGEKDYTILICRYFGTAACMAKLLTRKGLELVATALRFVNWGCPGGFETSNIRPNRWLKEERKTTTTSDG